MATQAKPILGTPYGTAVRPEGMTIPLGAMCGTGRIVEDMRQALFRGLTTNGHIRVHPKQPHGEDAFGYAFADIQNNCAESKQYDAAGKKHLLKSEFGRYYQAGKCPPLDVMFMDEEEVCELYRALKVCIEKDPQGNPKLREAFVDQFKLFTAMALAATAMLSRSMLLLNHPRDTVINVRRLMEAAKNWEADLAGGIVLDYPHPARAATTLMACFPPYPNIPWGVGEGTGPADAVMIPILQWADRYRQHDLFYTGRLTKFCSETSS
eukprot:jgi/Tetstr1/466155/TSEL_010716.t1